MFFDILGQPIKENQQFGEMNYSEGNRRYFYRTGIISKVTKDSYTVKYDSGPGSIKGSKRTWNGKLIVNFDLIPTDEANNEISDAYGQKIKKGQKFVEILWNDLEKKHYPIYGEIGDVHDRYFEVIIEGSKENRYRSNKIIQNYDIIKSKYPEIFL